MVGEDVEDDRRAVDHRDPDLLLEVPLLARQQLVVAGDQVRVGLAHRALQLGELPLAEIAVGVGTWTPLHKLAGHRHARRAQQLAKLREIGLGRRSGDAECALPGPRVADPLAVAALGGAAVATSFHPTQSRWLESRW